MKKLKFDRENGKLVFLVILILIIITLFTRYYGSADAGDYSDSAKFFSGKYAGDIRNSHSYLYGFIHSFFVGAFENFFFFKITSLVCLALIIYSVYYISNKDRKTLWLILLSPTAWYMAPWISPIQLSGLFLLWAWYFMKRYDESLKLSNLFYSGIFIGLGWAVWDTIVFFGAFLAISFLFQRKTSHSLYFVIFVLAGLLPRLILDQYLFNFPFYTILKSSFGTLTNAFLLGRGSAYVYENIIKNTLLFLYIIISIPLYYFFVYKRTSFIKNRKTILFLSASLLLILINPQIRYVLSIAPIIIILTGSYFSDAQFKKQVIFSLLAICFFVFPYVIQMGYNINDALTGVEVTSFISDFDKIKFSDRPYREILSEDIEAIADKFPDQYFIVGPTDDSFQVLCDVYWGSKVKEFVSVQDYNLYFKNQSVIFSKTFMPEINIRDRRQIWLAGGISKNEKDDTPYEEIQYMIVMGEDPGVEGFEKIETYNRLTLWRKTG